MNEATPCRATAAARRSGPERGTATRSKKNFGKRPHKGGWLFRFSDEARIGLHRCQGPIQPPHGLTHSLPVGPSAGSKPRPKTQQVSPTGSRSTLELRFLVPSGLSSLPPVTAVSGWSARSLRLQPTAPAARRQPFLAPMLAHLVHTSAALFELASPQSPWRRPRPPTPTRPSSTVLRIGLMQRPAAAC